MSYNIAIVNNCMHIDCNDSGQTPTHVMKSADVIFIVYEAAKNDFL